MKKRTLLVFTFATLALASCRTKETYPFNYLDTGKFETNFYSEHNGVKANQISTSIELSIDTSYSVYYEPISTGGKPIGGIKTEDQTINGKQLEWFEDKDKNEGYGPNKCLSNINGSFKEGILSRLYDGRVRCDGKTYARTRIQISQDGYSTYFPSTMSNGKYMAIALRGATNLENQKTDCNLANVDLKVCLYQRLENSSFREINFVLKGVPVETNTHGKTELVSFYFDEVFNENGIEDFEPYLNNVCAMSIGYELKYAANLRDGEQFGIMLYEFLLPSSSWR